MSLVIKEEEKQYETVTEGMHQAILAMIVDLGIQKTDYMGQIKQSRKVVFVFELDEKMKEGDNAGKPFVVTSKDLTLTWFKSNLLKITQGMVGKLSEVQKREGYDIEALIGKSCNINIALSEKGWAQIESVTPLMKGQEPIKDTVIESIPEFLVKRQKQAVDYFPPADTMADKASAVFDD